MFGSEILEVAIGLIFIFLISSLAVTSVREIIESVLKTRAVHLERGIRQLLDDPGGTMIAKDLYNHPLLYSLFAGDYDPRTQLTSFKLRNVQERVISTNGQPAIAEGKRLPFRSTLPSYIPSRNFALAIMDLVGGSAEGGAPLSLESVKAGAMTLPDGRLKQAMLVAMAEAEGDLDRARTSLEAWFDGTMDRVSGWYKRETQAILLVLGFMFAGVLNVNALTIVHDLATNNTLRNGLIARVDDVYQNRKTDQGTTGQPQFSEADLKSIRDGLSGVIGWERIRSQVEKDAKTLGAVDAWALNILVAALGWALTAVAVSLGAPFWFDLLNKLMVIRATVKPYEKSPAEGSEDRHGPEPSASRLAPQPGAGLVAGGQPATAGTAIPATAMAGAPVVANLRLAINAWTLDPGSAQLTVGGTLIPVPSDGFVELPLPVDASHPITVNATRNGAAVSWTGSFEPKFDSEAFPLFAKL